jgi:aspartate aminotransferase-like enzyme
VITTPPLSHRSREYLQLHYEVQNSLKRLVNARHVQILIGTGTLANEAVAAQLSLLPGEGLILSNGEFGERLIHQARGFGLTFKTLSLEWGQCFDAQHLEKTIRRIPDIRWIWTVHSETSTGMLNDIEMLTSVSRDYGLHLCMDCISSIGNTPVDLQHVYLASACSSKGLRSVAGLALVFYNHTLMPPRRPLNSYLNLYAYEQANGVQFTIPSNLVNALAAALKECDARERFSKMIALDNWLRNRLIRLGLVPLTNGSAACPGIITLTLQQPRCSRTLGDALKAAGFLVSYESRYLLERNWLQVCLMGTLSKSRLRGLVETLESIL